MKSKKGFTLIELIMVIVLIGILMLIAIPTVRKYMNKGTKSYYESIEGELKTAGMNYLETYKTLLPRQIGNVQSVTVEELVQNKYIDPIVDENGNLCTGEVIVKKVKTDAYNYYSYIDCGDAYKTPDDDKPNPDDNKYPNEDNDEYDIVIDEDPSCDNHGCLLCNGNKCPSCEDGNCGYKENGFVFDPRTGKIIVEQGQKVTLQNAKVYNKDRTEVITTIPPKPSKIDTNVLGETEVKYTYRGKTVNLVFVVVDRKAPSAPEAVVKYLGSSVKYDHKEGNSYRGDWFSGNLAAEYKSTDYVKPGVMGSGIKEYQVSENGTDWIRLSGNSETRVEEGHYTRYLRSIDNSGNISATGSYEYKIDKTKPNVGTAEIIGGTIDEAGWYLDNVTVRITAGDDPCSVNECSGTKKVTYSYITKSTGPTKTVPETEIPSGNTIVISNNGVTTITVYTYDNANNRSDSITLIVKKDEPQPEIYNNFGTGNVSLTHSDNMTPWDGNDYFFRMFNHVHKAYGRVVEGGKGMSQSGGCYTKHIQYESNDCVSYHSGSGSSYTADCETCTYNGRCRRSCSCGYENYCENYESHHCVRREKVTHNYYARNCGITPRLGKIYLEHATNNQRVRLRIRQDGEGIITSIQWNGGPVGIPILKKNDSEVILNAPGTYTVTFTYSYGEYTRIHTFKYVNTNPLQ